MRTRLTVGAVVGIAGFLTGVLLFFALTGCSAGGGSGGGSGSGAAGSSSQGGSSVQQQARVVWLAYARCVRSHGSPNFPDPQVDAQGKPDFGNSPQVKTEGLQAQGACGSILSRLPAAATGQIPGTPAVLHTEVLFAGCMRRHGLPDWPDPRPDGTFQLAGTPYAAMGKSGPVLTAMQACRQYETFGGIRGAS
jgi:hypothetical protein